MTNDLENRMQGEHDETEDKRRTEQNEEERLTRDSERALALSRLAAAGILRRRRVLVAVDNSPTSQAALNIAARMAATLQMELAGLYIEDSDLLRLARLPFATEVRYGRAAPERLSEAVMLRQMRVRAAAVQAIVEAVAEAHRIRTSFRIATGSPSRLLLDAGEDVDIVALGRLGHALHRRQPGSTAAEAIRSLRRITLIAGREADGEGNVAAVIDDSASAKHVIDLAGLLTDSDDVMRLTILAESDEEAGTLRESVMTAVAHLRGAVDISHVPATNHQKLIEHLLGEGIGFVVISDGRDRVSTERIRHLLAVEDWHLLIVRQ